ncbi:MAG: hypothetical protein NTZ01_07305, partial [Verrucomicrobia bacterium]|nr:hypothetical protein [Verrucomicrobiota bacterium]
GMTVQDLMDKRADGQDHPGSIVSRVLAQRLRKTNEKLEAFEKGGGAGDLVPEATPALAAQPAVTSPMPIRAPAGSPGSKILLRMGWRTGDHVTWGKNVTEHSLPMIFGRNPGPTGVAAGTELVLLEENPPQRLSPMQFMVESKDGAFFLKDEQSEMGNEVSGVSVGLAAGVTQVQLPAGTHVLIAGGEGSPYVMALEIPVMG